MWYIISFIISTYVLYKFDDRVVDVWTFKKLIKLNTNFVQKSHMLVITMYNKSFVQILFIQWRWWQLKLFTQI